MFCKKILPISILAVAMACMTVIPSATVSALYQDDQENQWWSVDELMQYAKEVDAEENALCGDDIGCKEELFFSKLDAHNQKYESLDMFKQQQFWVTSINPETEKLDMIYFDQDPMLSRMGIEERDPLRLIYIAWSLQGKSDVGNINPDLPLEPQIDASDVRVVYAGDSGEFSPDGFPANQVFTLPIRSTDLSANTRGHLLANTYGHSFYNASTGINYSSCLNSPSYTRGESCDLMFSAGQGSRYFPHNLITSSTVAVDENDAENDPADEQPSGSTSVIPSISATSSVSTAPSTSSPSSTPSSAPSPAPLPSGDESSSTQFGAVTTDSTADYSLEPSLASTALSSTTASNAAKPLAESIELPKTGDPQTECEREVIFPWWLIVLLIVADATIMWFFWSKNQKKSRKTLDKKTDVR